jgi:hypothetical protein
MADTVAVIVAVIVIVTVAVAGLVVNAEVVAEAVADVMAVGVGADVVRAAGVVKLRLRLLVLVSAVLVSAVLVSALLVSPHWWVVGCRVLRKRRGGSL